VLRVRTVLLLSVWSAELLRRFLASGSLRSFRCLDSVTWQWQQSDEFDRPWWYEPVPCAPMHAVSYPARYHRPFLSIARSLDFDGLTVRVYMVSHSSVVGKGIKIINTGCAKNRSFRPSLLWQRFAILVKLSSWTFKRFDDTFILLITIKGDYSTAAIMVVHYAQP